MQHGYILLTLNSIFVFNEQTKNLTLKKINKRLGRGWGSERGDAVRSTDDETLPGNINFHLKRKYLCNSLHSSIKCRIATNAARSNDVCA